MPSQTVISLAVLQVNWDKHGKDYLENFVPMVAECVRLSKNDVVSTPDLKESLETNFGLKFPESALDTIIKRLKKRGYLKVENKTYFKNPANLSKLNFQETQQKVIIMHDALITKMIDFCKNSFNFQCNPQEAETYLLAFLKEYDLEIMAAFRTGTLIPDISPTGKSAKYYIAKYINHLQDTQSAELDYLEKVVEGNMLANAIFLPDPMRADQSFHNTKLFFDSTFLIYALGYAGKPRQEPCTELLDMLYETGADLRCFSHINDEIIGILDACSRRIKKGERSDPFGTVDYFIEKEYTESDIQLLINNLQNNLKALKIQIEEKPPYRPENLIDEAGLTKTINDKIHYTNPKAVIRDVDSISAIMRLRHGQVYYSVENCCSLLITTNSILASVARYFFHYAASDRIISPCIDDRSLTNLLWLKKPIKMPDLPMKRIIADCYAALQPDEHLIHLYLEKIRHIEQKGEITPDDILMLRYSLEAKQALMDLTSGEEDIFAHVTVKEVLELVRERIQLKIREEIQAKADAEINKTRIELESTKTLLVKKDLELIRAEDTIGELKASELTRDNKLKSRASNIANVIGLAFKIAVLPIILIGLAFSLPWQFPSISDSPLRYGIAAILFILLILTSFNLIAGTTVKSTARIIEMKSQKLILRLLKSLTS